MGQERYQTISAKTDCAELLELWWQQKQFSEITQFLCYSMPALQILNWCYLCLTPSLQHLPSKQSLFDRWHAHPDNDSRRSINGLLKNSDYQSAADWLAGAIVWQHMPDKPRYLYAHAATNAIYLSALVKDKRAATHRNFSNYLTTVFESSHLKSRHLKKRAKPFS